jgi:hypothetical protein
MFTFDTVANADDVAQQPPVLIDAIGYRLRDSRTRVPAKAETSSAAKPPSRNTRDRRRPPGVLVAVAVVTPAVQASGPDDRALYRGGDLALAPTTQRPDDPLPRRLRQPGPGRRQSRRPAVRAQRDRDRAGIASGRGHRLRVGLRLGRRGDRKHVRRGVGATCRRSGRRCKSAPQVAAKRVEVAGNSCASSAAAGRPSASAASART